MSVPQRNNIPQVQGVNGLFALRPEVASSFWVPEELKKAAGKRRVNDFTGERAWASIKLRGWGQYRVDADRSANETRVPSGYYVRECVGREAEMISITFMPSCRIGAENVRMQVEPGTWFRVFYVTRDWIVSRLFTNDRYYINQMSEEDREVSTSGRVFSVLGRAVKNGGKTKRDAETAYLDEQIKVRKELVHARDMDRSKIEWTERGIAFCEECGFYQGCQCGKCIRCCLQEAGCTLPKHVWRQSRIERGLETETYRKKNDRSKQRMREFLRRRDDPDNEGPAHSWFFPSSSEHNVNVNFKFQFLEDLAKAFSSKNQEVPWKEVLKNFGFMCAHLYTGKSATRWIAVTQFIMSLPLEEEVISALFKRAKGWFGSNAQAAEVEGLFVPLLTLLGVVVATLGIGKIPSDKDTMNFITKLSKIGSCIKSLEVVKDYIQPAMEAVIDYIRVQFFGYSSTDLHAWKEYEDYCKEIQELNNSGFEERLKTEKELVIKIDDLLIRGDNLMKMLDQLRVPANQRTRFNSAYAWLGRMRNEAAHCSAGKHIPRVPPVVFHILGTTGVGKSEATSLLNARLLTSLGHEDPNDLYTKVYYRDCGQERFDGYNSGVVGVVVDDFGSRVDTEMTPSSDALEAIRMQNSAVWQLPMASLSEKGSTFFRAKYVIWTSNRATFKFKSITNPEAVLRRVTLKFRQKPRPEFSVLRKLGTEQVEMLDRQKIAEAAKERPDVYEDVWLFDLVDAHEDPTPADSATGGVKVLKSDLSFDEMAKMCENELKHAQITGNAKLEHTARYFEKCVKNKGQAQGCWDWWNKNISDLSNPEEGWEHVFIGDKMRGKFYEGEDVSNSVEENWKGFAEWDKIPPHPHLEQFRHHTCFYVKGGTKMRIRFVRAYYEAMAVDRRAWHTPRSEEEKSELFAKVLGKSNIPATRVRVCDEHQSTYWTRWFDAQDTVKKWAWSTFTSATSFIPDEWLVPVVLAFEAFIEVFLLTCGYLVVVNLPRWFGQFIRWLFPGLDKERRKKEELYQESVVRMKEYDVPPVELLLLIEKLEEELDVPENLRVKREIGVEHLQKMMLERQRNDERKKGFNRCWCGDDITMCIHTAESFQEQTQGARARNVESFQERTQGARQRNVESVQERTIGCRPKNVEVSQGAAEATNDQNAVEVVQKVKRNVYGIQILDGDDRYFVGNLLFVVGKIAITNKHILRVIKGKEVRIFNVHSQKGMVLTKEQTENMSVSSEESELHGMKDVVAIEMPRQCLVHADIRGFFQTKEDFSRHVQPAGVCVLGYGRDCMIQGRYSDRCQAVDRVHFDLIEKNGNTTQVREWYRYGVHSSPGDCGSVVIVHDPSVSRKIVGLHMAGYGSEGFFGVGVAVHQQLLTSLVNGLVLKNAESDLDGTFAYEGEPTDRSFGDFVSYGTAAAVAGSMKSVIHEGPIFGMLATPKTAPAKLRPFKKDGEIIDPLEMARKKADTVNVPVNEAILKQCSNHYAQKLLDLKKTDEDDRVLTWEQAIQGTGEELYNPVKRNTSPGYGWDAKGKGKEPWLGSGETYVTDHPEVLKRRDEMLERIHKGQRASTVFIDTLKDERRPLDRVEAGKTRLFAAGEMVFCLLFRQYFAGFNAHVMRNCIDAESTVGINPFGWDWNKLGMKLSEQGPCVVAGDFSNYDGTLNAAILWEVYDVVERFYENATDEDRKIRRALWCELVNSVHLTVPFEGTAPEKKAYLYQWSHSQPSGNPMTVILNSVYHSIAMRYVYKLCARKYCPTLVGLDNFDKMVAHVNYGDDDVTNIHPKIIGWFNQVTMTEAFLEIGMVYTDEAKSGQLVEYRTLEEIAFLKRKFRWDGEQVRWRCPHSLDTIMEMAMWVKRGANVHEITAVVLEEAVHELAQHEKEVFDEKMKLFMKARAVILPYWPCTFLTYEEYAEVDMSRMGWLGRIDVRNSKEIDDLFE